MANTAQNTDGTLPPIFEDGGSELVSKLNKAPSSIEERKIERSEGPFMTQIGEFGYWEDKGTLVRKDQPYHIHYLKNKKVIYELDVNGQRIVRDRRVPQEVYYSVHSTQRDEYPSKSFPTAKNLPFKQKYITRVFAQNKLYPEAEVMEVKRKTKTNSYRFTSIKWQISGSPGKAELFNKKQLMMASRVFPDLAERIPLLQLHESKVLRTETSIDMLLINPNYSGSMLDYHEWNTPPPSLDLDKEFGL